MSSPELFSGQGKIYLADRDPSGNPKGFSFMGNSPNFSVRPITELSSRIESNNDPSSYLDNSEDRSSSYSVNFTLDAFTLENLQYILYGEADVIPAGSATIQKQLYYGRNILGEVNLTSCVVSGSPNGIQIDLKNGVIEIPKDSLIVEGLYYNISYSWAEHTAVNMFSKRVKDKWLRFEGVNSVDLSTIVFDLPRVRLLPAELELISDGIYEADFNGVGLRDAYSVFGNEFAKVHI